MRHDSRLPDLTRTTVPAAVGAPTRVAGLANVIVLDVDSSTTPTADVVA
ncbi:hypothetical protein [Salinispora arenicola]|nr:hypothetical protein [Salinispora arenicola]